MQMIGEYHTLIRTNATFVELCVHAGAVKEAWLQISNSDDHVRKWDEIKRYACIEDGDRRISGNSILGRTAIDAVRDGVQ